MSDNDTIIILHSNSATLDETDTMSEENDYKFMSDDDSIEDGEEDAEDEEDNTKKHNEFDTRKLIQNFLND